MIILRRVEAIGDSYKYGYMDVALLFILLRLRRAWYVYEQFQDNSRYNYRSTVWHGDDGRPFGHDISLFIMEK